MKKLNKNFNKAKDNKIFLINLYQVIQLKFLMVILMKKL